MIPNLAVTEQYHRLAKLARNPRGFQASLLAKYFFLFNVVVSETKAHWIYRGADDSLVNLCLLRTYLQKLDRFFNPMRDVVVLGNCVFNGHPYPQGGAGVILSRRAVEKLAPMAVASMTGMNTWEDSQFGWMLESIGIRVQTRTASVAFLGVGFDRQQFALVRSGNISNLSPCPKATKSNPQKCPVMLARLRETIFFHTFRNVSWSERHAIMMAMTQAPNEVYWYQPTGIRPTLCRATQVSALGWMDNQTIF
jgi:hypothetical protein